MRATSAPARRILTCRKRPAAAARRSERGSTCSCIAPATTPRDSAQAQDDHCRPSPQQRPRISRRRSISCGLGAIRLSSCPPGPLLQTRNLPRCARCSLLYPLPSLPSCPFSPTSYPSPFLPSFHFPKSHLLVFKALGPQRTKKRNFSLFSR